MHDESEDAAETLLLQFIEKVRATGEVWGLASEEDGWANSPSLDDEEADVLVFWSTRDQAEAHRRDEWSRHEPTSVSLEDFVNLWLPGMAEDGVLIGPDWTTEMVGLEMPADELAEEIIGAEDEEEDDQ